MQDLPLAGIVPVVLVILIGLLLWAAGRQLLRTGFAAAGLLIGATLGWLIAEQLNIGVPAWAGALVLGIALAAFAALTYRLAVAGALAIVLAVASPMAVIAISDMQGVLAPDNGEAHDILGDSPHDDTEHEVNGPPSRTIGDEIDRWLNDRLREQLPPGMPYQDQSSEELAQQFGVSPEISQHVEQVKSIAERILSGLRSAWQQTPENLRPMLIAAAVIGALLGLLIGALVPAMSAIVVTSFGGGMLWLTGVSILAERFVEGAFLPSTSKGWMVLWLVISVLGLVIQWIFRPKRADNSQR
jgi:F0F1-type ATP synthase assembly protein I